MAGNRNSESKAKRRKVRKGTRSCWECKGRKMKCVFMTPDDSVCEGCIRRGTSCVSQELPEHPIGKVDRKQQIGNRMVRVEALLGKLVKATVEHPAGSTQYTPQDIVEDASAISSLDSHVASPPEMEAQEPCILPKYQEMSKALLGLFPSQESVIVMVQLAGLIPPYFHQLVRKPSSQDFQIGEKEKRDLRIELTVRHTPQIHPLIIVRQALLLAISFRYIHPSSHGSLTGFVESPEYVMQRLADASISLVETSDSMMNTTEGLECLLLASSFHADTGNLRSAWSTTRRAMFLAQLMSLHRQTRLPPKSIQAENKWDPQFLWYRIVFFDRFFSLILGLPQGSTDESMASVAALEKDTPIGRLQRRHCVLAGRILERNESDPKLDDFRETLAIDEELRSVAESMPSKWWLVPNLASMQSEVELYWATMGLGCQVYHNILLSQLHLPFMLQATTGPHQERYEYSRVACVHASRDLLHRYMSLRTYSSVSYCCHSMDFFAMTASITLLLAHLDGYRSKKDSAKALLHQRTSDRAMIEEILDNMEKTGTLNKATGLSERGACILRRLLAIEAYAARNSTTHTATKGSLQHEDHSVRLIIPYFGVVRITQFGDITKEGHEPVFGREAANDIDIQPAHHGVEVHLTTTGVPPLAILEQESMDFLPDPVGFPQLQSPTSGFADQLDWSFQDAHLAFLDTMMQGQLQGTDLNGDSWWLL